VWAATRGGGGKKHTATRAAGSVVPHLRGTGAYDPYGGDGEHDADAPKATDRDGQTFWTTEHYTSGLNKPGVGLVLDAGRSMRVRQIGIATDTPGFTASIRASDSASGGFTAVAPSQTVAGTAQFVLHGPPRRYYLIWITRLGAGYDQAHVNEVSAT
jgi:hypothetical protein